MKQILHNLKTGGTTVVDVPCPSAHKGHVLIRSERTLVSAGTERMLVAFGKAGWIEKARQQPDKVRQVLDKVRTDGLLPTLETVRNKLDQPLPLGYCNAGVVIDVGAGVTAFGVGDRVVSNGHHADVVSVPANLCARIPHGVSADEAAFTVIAAIALQGIRLAKPTLGETVVVTGLGLVGLVAVQLLRANGCRVLGIDFDAQRLALAKEFGAEVVDLAGHEDPVARAHGFSRGRGVDAVVIAASTVSSQPVHEAALMCRKRGRIVLVGVTGLELSRADFYEKELSFQVSCSYGPGRYDANYEEKGLDYPIGFVRWTEQRNFEAVLDLMGSGQLNVMPLISHRFSIDEAESAYELVSQPSGPLGILLEYGTLEPKSEDELRQQVVRVATPGLPQGDSVKLGFIGSGNYATGVLIPAFLNAGARPVIVASRGGVTGTHAARKFGFERVTTDTGEVFNDTCLDAVVVATRHDSHAGLVIQALQAGKHVFVEKPLALTMDHLTEIENMYHALGQSAPLLMVGFNRRFAPHVAKMKVLLRGVTQPKALVMTVNAGEIPAEHWTQDRDVGGGRIVGEVCHFIDLFRFLVGSPITELQAASLGKPMGVTVADDKASITLRFADGSLGTILYFANGHKSLSKERLEVFTAGRVLQLNNYRSLRGFGWPGFSRMRLWKHDKGQKACAAAFVRAINDGGSSPIPFDEVLEVSRAAVAAAEALR